MKKMNLFMAAMLTMLSFGSAAKAADPIDFPSLKVGDVIKLGSFEQDGNAENGAEPIEWEIVFVKGKAALMISKYGLENYNFQPDRGPAPSKIQDAFLTLTKWTSKEFKKKAFTKEEASHVKETLVLTSKDAKKYLADYKNMAVKATEAAKAKGAAVNENGVARWWLANDVDPYTGRHYSVNEAGTVDDSAFLFKSKDGVIRPAAWIVLK